MFELQVLKLENNWVDQNNLVNKSNYFAYLSIYN